MKHLKKFNEKLEESYKMDDYLWLPLFCTRNGRDLDCKIFNEKNVGGYGLGIRGDYFNESDFSLAMSKKGDSIGRRLYTPNESDILIKDLGLDNISKGDAVDRIVNMISGVRSSYTSSRPEVDINEGVYVELEEIKDMLL